MILMVKPMGPHGSGVSGPGWSKLATLLSDRQQELVGRGFCHAVAAGVTRPGLGAS